PERDELWYSTNRELRRIDARGQLIELDSLGFYPQEIVRTADEVLWLPTWRRQAYQPGIKELLFYKRPNDPVSLVESDQIQIYNYSNDRSFTQTRVDPKGRIWNFDGNRLEVISERWLWRKGLTKTLSKARTGRITSIYFDRNDLAFVGTEDGFFIFNLKPNRFTPFLKEEGESTRAIVDYYPDSILVFTYGHNYMIHKFNGGKRILPELYNANVFGAIVDSSGVIWAGNHSNRLYRIDPRTAERKPYFFKKEQELQGFVLIPHLDERTGRIWLATQKGLAYLDPGMEELLWYFPGKDFERLNELTITHFHQNENGLWLSTNQGIFLHRVGEGIVKHYDRFPYASINHIYEDEAGIFWLSTLGGGLLRWDYRRDGEVRQFVEEDGLSDNVIYSAMGDELGNLWLPSNHGLMRMNRQDFSVRTYFPSDGLTHEEFNNISACRGREGRFYLGGLKGLVSFDPARMVSKQAGQDRLLITAMQKGDPNTGKMLDVLLDYRRKGVLELKPAEKNFSLYFTLPFFQAPDQLRYAYRIEGRDEDWRYISKNNLNINSLPYGRSKLRLRAQGGSFVSSEELVIPIHAKRPIHHHLWFRLLVLVLVLVALVLIINWRLRALQRDKLLLEQLVEKRTQEIQAKNGELAALNQTKDQFFGIIAHDLRGPMLSFRGLNKKLKYLIATQQEDRIEALGQSVDRAYDKLDRLLDNLLSWALVQRGTLPFEPEQLRLAELTREVIALFADVAESKGIILENRLPEELELRADANALSAILRNLINNAIKFSPAATTIRVDVVLRESSCELLVCDEGEGFSEEELGELFKLSAKRGGSKRKKAKGTGLGLQLCKELMELHGGTIRIESQPAVGTQIYLHFPYPAQRGRLQSSDNKQSAGKDSF
ncbi:MAG: ATP-binding protein, partial [Bacteroidota bacterium]